MFLQISFKYNNTTSLITYRRKCTFLSLNADTAAQNVCTGKLSVILKFSILLEEEGRTCHGSCAQRFIEPRLNTKTGLFTAIYAQRGWKETFTIWNISVCGGLSRYKGYIDEREMKSFDPLRVKWWWVTQNLYMGLVVVCGASPQTKISAETVM